MAEPEVREYTYYTPQYPKVLFPENAEQALKAIGTLRLVDLPEKPKLSDVLGDWAKNFISSFYGSYDVAKGIRYIQNFFLLVAKKNGKSTLAAALMLSALIFNTKVHAEFIIIAPTKEIAENSFKPIVGMIRADQTLATYFKVSNSRKLITDLRDVSEGSTLKVMAPDNSTVAGVNATGVLVDEVWGFGNKEAAHSIFREALGGLASKKDGFAIFLSTQSEKPPRGVFQSRLNYARQVRDGTIIDSNFLPILYEYPAEIVESGLYNQGDYIKLSNPNLDRSVRPEFLEMEEQKAILEGRQAHAIFLAKHFNIQVKAGSLGENWGASAYWLQNQEDYTLDEMLDNSVVTAIGIDGGGFYDLLAVTVVAVDKNDIWRIWSHSFLAPEALKKQSKIAQALHDFAETKYLEIMPSRNMYDEIIILVNKLAARGNLCGVGIDKLGSSELRDNLAKLFGDLIVDVSQGGYLQPSMKAVEARLDSGRLKHNGNPLMGWSVDGAKEVEGGGNTRSLKKGSSTSKIDPIIALFNAVKILSDSFYRKGGGIDVA